MVHFVLLIVVIHLSERSLTNINNTIYQPITQLQIVYILQYCLFTCIYLLVCKPLLLTELYVYILHTCHIDN